MRSFAVSAVAAAVLIATHAPSPAAVKEVAYPLLKVQFADAYQPDAAFTKMQKALTDAVAKKDTQRLLALVGPTFVWRTGGDISDQFDFGGDALQNFKVVFGFRQFGKRVDGGVADGPFWDILSAFVSDNSYDIISDTLVCGPTIATLDDPDAFEAAKQKIGADDSIQWYVTVDDDTSVSATPAGTGAPVGHIGPAALPVLASYPEQRDSGPPPSHLKVLLPSGKSGWIPVTAAIPLESDRLCYALTASGDWKIAGFDQAQ
jgi:hypothetical protein